jgi:organic hydroperoxide reductase OsmC/OhrA
MVAPGTDYGLVRTLLEEAHATCFIANSLISRVTIEPTIIDAQPAAVSSAAG